MSADEKRVQDYLEQIRSRVDNWAQGKGYGPGGWPKDAPVHDVVFLFNHIADLQEERQELQERVKELEVYEEIEMIGPPPGLPTVGGALRERDTAQAEAENTRYQLDWANERIRDLENDIRSHKRVCPMFR